MKKGDNVVVVGRKDSHGINEPVYIAKIVAVDEFNCVVEIIKCLNEYVRVNPSIKISPTIELFPRKFIKPLNYLKMYENRR